MTVLRAAFILLAVVALVLISGAAAAQEAQPPCHFHGKVEVNGRAVAEDTVITAVLDGDQYTAETTLTQEGDSVYSLLVAPPPGRLYASCADVDFMIGNIAALESGRFAPGGNLTLDLSATVAQIPCRFHGTVLMNGKAVADDTEITAIVRGQSSTTKTTTVDSSSTYSIELAPEKGTEYPEGSDVIFIVDRFPAEQSGNWTEGGDVRLDLTAEGEGGSPTLIPTIAFLLITGAVVLVLSPLRRKLNRGPTTRYLTWLAAAGLVIAGIWLFSRFNWTFWDFPTDQYIPLRDWANTAVDWLTLNFAPLFDFIALVIREPYVAIKNGLFWLPWWSALLILTGVAWWAAGVRVAALTGIGLFFVGTLGHVQPDSVFWELTMITLAIMIVSVVISLLIGIPTGIIAGRSDRFEAMIRPVLDLMQTMPSFVYLVPAVMFFHLGAVPAVIATVIYAVPPCIRLTSLGIRQVSPEVVEAGKAFGSTPMQLLLKIQLPLAMPSIMAGVTQTIMLALAMVVIASMIGAGGLGIEVLRGINQLNTGRALTAGLSIVVLAIIFDRVSQSVGSRTRTSKPGTQGLLRRVVASLPSRPVNRPARQEQGSSIDE